MTLRHARTRVLAAGIALVGAAGAAGAISLTATGGVATVVPAVAAVPATTTPIQHVVVIIDENVSFDHYFATYPVAANTDGEPFTPRRTLPL